MAQDTTQTSQEKQPQAQATTVDREMNRAHLKSVAAIHTVVVMAAVTLWGAADTWAVSTSWGLAWVAAIVNAVIAGYAIAGVLHEWGHYAGARLSGSVAPVMEKPIKYFFMFNFSFEKNNKRQFMWMSLGGIVVPWLLVMLTPLLVPIDNASRAMLFAVFVTRAVQVSLFELPVVLRTHQGGEARAELGRQLKAGFTTSRYAGVAVGALVWLALSV